MNINAHFCKLSNRRASILADVWSVKSLKCVRVFVNSMFTV